VSRAARIAVAGAVLVAIGAAIWLPLPYYAMGPGPVRDVGPLIRFDGYERFGSAGTIVMTTVRWFRVTPTRAVQVWLDDAWSLVDQRQLFPPDVDPDEEERISTAQMDQSQVHAAYVVLERLTDYPDEHGPGVLVEGTVPDCPADGVLFPGELVVSIDGSTVRSTRAAARLIEARPPGEPIAFVVRADDGDHEVELARSRCVPDRRKAFVGVSFVPAFPIELRVEDADVGGPSAGLMLALGLYDLMTPGDLTGGRVVAGTGTIDLDGRVGAVGGVRDKVLGAARAGADVFLVPRGNLEELEGLDTGSMRIVAVRRFGEAVEALVAAGGSDGGRAVERLS
jgi:PDZ domain-containing protein